jgi:hypothetical protein
MKKRVISTLLCATMLVGMITGCGSNNTESAGLQTVHTQIPHSRIK